MIETRSTPARSQISRLGANVVYNWGSFAFTALVSFFLSPFIVNHLGASGYGIWTLVVSLTGYLGLLDMGVRGAVTRYVAKFHTTEELHEVNQIVSSALVIFVGAGALAILASIALALFAVHRFSIPSQYVQSARLVLVIAGITVAVSFVSGVFGGVVIGLQRFDLSNLVEVLSTAARSLAIVLALKHEGGIVALSAIQLAFSILGCVVHWQIAQNVCPYLRITFSQADRRNLRLILSFSAYSFVLQISSYLVYYTDSIVIGAFLPVSAITFFAIAGNLITYARAPLSSISVTMTPFASSVEARNDHEQLRRTVLKVCRYSTAIMLPVAITFLLRGGSFIGLWMGPAYAELSGEVLSILTLAWLFSAGNWPLGATMLGLSKHKGLIPAIVAEGLCNLLLSVVLVRKMGIAGVAWGTTMPNLAVNLIFWPWYLRKILDIPISAHAASAWIRPGLAAIPFAICTFCVERWCAARSLTVFFLQVIASLSVWLAFAWFFVVERSDRISIARWCSAWTAPGSVRRANLHD